MTFESQKLNCIYLPFDIPVSNLKEALKSLIVLGVKGVNVTIPHKERIIQYLDHVSEAAASVGAVNTVVNQSGQLYGYNTDVDGIIETFLPYKNDIAKSTVTIVGAGGAARAVLYTLIRHFKVGKINIINRTEERSESLKDYFKDKMHFSNIDTYELMAKENVEVYQSSKVIVNATSIGLFPNTDDTPTDIADSFNSNQIVFDLIYNPLKTKFLKIAETKKAEVINGLKMFVVQGAKIL
jgi:shikimate dehydrogenase